MKKISRKFNIPLHVIIGIMASVLVILCGGIIGSSSYLSISRAVGDLNTQMIDSITRSTRNLIASRFSTTSIAIELLSRSQLDYVSQRDSLEFPQSLLWNTLKNMRGCRSIYMGYQNGAFLMVRSLEDGLAERMDAPNEALFVVTRLSSNKEKNARHIFYSAKEVEISRKEDPAYILDVKARPWYIDALNADKPVATDVYQFYSSKEMGMSISCASPERDYVVGIDFSFPAVAQFLENQKVSENSILALLDGKGKIIVGSAALKDFDKEKVNSINLRRADTGLVQQAYQVSSDESELYEFEYGDESWFGCKRAVGESMGNGLVLAFVVPRKELLSRVHDALNNTGLLTVIIIIIMIPVSWICSRRISTPLQLLASEIDVVRNFNFDSSTDIPSSVKEIGELAGSFAQMKSTILQFQTLSTELIGKQSFDRLLSKVVSSTVEQIHAYAGGVYLIDESDEQLKQKSVHAESLTTDQLNKLFGTLEESGLIACQNDDDVKFVPLIKETCPTGIYELLSREGDVEPYLMSVPLYNRAEERIGALALVVKHQITGTDNEHVISFVKALASYAALAIEGQLLLEQQKQLLESFIQIIAGAIDSKSPYTGGHCQRVPVLTKMLVNAACESDAEEFSEFSLSEEEWEELHIAAWLHDCGKITTPEYVVDKATKLETIYNRIHEIRMRFEVLKREADIDYWKGCADGGDVGQLAEIRDQLHRKLDNDFELVAECNLGSEHLADEMIERLKSISEMTWTRTINDKLGVSAEEYASKLRNNSALPAIEKVLDDKDEHIVYRDLDEAKLFNDELGVKMDVPEFRFNRGELYNLSNQHGTLTAEERYIINNHIIETLAMLSKLPFPKHLQNVADIAGAHHERIDGEGYPRKIHADTLPLTARAMAIADIFEALTASDRPYKKPLPIDKALEIMEGMAEKKHIDKELLHLFVDSGVARDYETQFL